MELLIKHPSNPLGLVLNSPLISYFKEAILGAFFVCLYRQTFFDLVGQLHYRSFSRINGVILFVHKFMHIWSDVSALYCYVHWLFFVSIGVQGNFERHSKWLYPFLHWLFIELCFQNTKWDARYALVKFPYQHLGPHHLHEKSKLW
jgi:hypothetical protein